MRNKILKIILGGAFVLLVALAIGTTPVGVKKAQAAPSACPSVGTVIDGHTITQADNNACVSATLGGTVTTKNPDLIASPVTGNVTSQTTGQVIPRPGSSVTSQITCSSLANCMALIVYYVGPALASQIAYIGAAFFSIVIQLSLNSTAYALNFLSTGWELVRDLANMAFIFILIYLALTIMLQAETAGTIKTLATVVVIALLVNFSFFFTRVAIDAGNILAVQFYNAIPLGQYSNGTPAMVGGAKDLSFAIMNGLGTQSLLNQQQFDAVKTAVGTQGGWAAEIGGLAVLTVAYLAIAVIFWLLFFSFLQVGIKFMLRIVGLWFVLISSPLAFVAKTNEKTAHFFDKWLKYLIEFSFYPAIFLFMFYLLTQIVSTIFAANTTGNGAGGIFGEIINATPGSPGASSIGFLAAIATVSIKMGFIVALIYIGLNVSEWIVKEGSAEASKAMGWAKSKSLGAAGWASGKSLGAVGAVARTTIGYGALRAAQSTRMRNWAAEGGLLRRNAWRAAGALGKASFDARGVGLLKTGASKLGLEVGDAKGEGGFLAREQKRTEWREKESKALKPTDRQLSDSLGGVLSKLDKDQRQRLMNAAGTYSQKIEDRKNNLASQKEVNDARDEYNQVVKNLTVTGADGKVKDLKTAIVDAKKAVGGDNAKTYAKSLETHDWRNVWSLASHPYFPFWKYTAVADQEAIAQIRGSDKDADRVKNMLGSKGEKVADGYETPARPDRGSRAPATPPREEGEEDDVHRDDTEH